MLSQSDEPALVSLMLANNETGVIQPVAQAAHMAHAAGAFVHCDAVQAAGRVEIDMRCARGRCDFACPPTSWAGRWASVPWCWPIPLDEIAPILHGGAQEARRRAGTENVPGIAGFGAAVAAVRAEMVTLAARLTRLRDGLERSVRARVPSVNLFGDRARMRVPNTSCFAVPGVEARTLVIALDLEGVAVSAGAACSSGRIEPSHVLAAMGAGPLAASAIRVSLGWTTTQTDVDDFVAAFVSLMARLGVRTASAA